MADARDSKSRSRKGVRVQVPPSGFPAPAAARSAAANLPPGVRMLTHQLPSVILGATVVAYWGCVLAMIIRVSRRTKRVDRILIPAQRREQLMWLVLTPLIVFWMTLPWLALARGAAENPWLAPGPWARDGGVLILRLAAAALGVICLALSIWCWRHMGRHWRMAVDPAQQGKLFVDGPFAYVRHPIYALGIMLVACSVIAAATPPMVLVAVTYVAVMNAKARNEERHLRAKFGPAYDEYCRRTGRFFPIPASPRPANEVGT